MRKGILEMNRLEFHCENGKTQVELHDVEVIGENEARTVFRIKEKPVYLQIFFHKILDEGQLRDLYNMIMAYNLIEMSYEKLEFAIYEDIIHHDHGAWEIKCYNFQNAFECCYEALAKSYMVEDGALSFQLSDEPSEMMKHWREKKMKDVIQNEFENFDG